MRHELKYFLSEADAYLLKKQLSYLFSADSHALPDGTYRVTSLYFDDPDNTAFFEKLDGRRDRDKYRIRIYNNSDSHITLEKKSKRGDMTDKKASVIDKATAQALIDGSFETKPGSDSLIADFLAARRIKKLRPFVIVEYRRTAFVYSTENTRITVDEELSYSKSSSLFSPDITLSLHPGREKRTVEVKFDGVLPRHISGILSAFPLERTALSKFAVAAGALM